MLDSYFDKKTEITIELNPNSTKIEFLKELKNLGVNRISFGVQTFNNEKLKFLGRNHTSKTAIDSIQNGLKIFNNVNLDLIYSTKLDTKQLLENDLNIALKLGVTHISAYSLTIEKNTKFYKTPESKKYDENLEIWFIDEVKKEFPQYEISNFGKVCNHNLGYWKLNNYIGLGAGAVGFDGEKREYTHKSVEEYIKNPTFKKYEYLTDYDLKEEQILLGLRSIIGFNKNILTKQEEEKCFELVGDKLYFKDNRFYSKDFLLADALTLWILE
jgi:oxygen-independent coproporphyrinogen-3 oxidase